MALPRSLFAHYLKLYIASTGITQVPRHESHAMSPTCDDAQRLSYPGSQPPLPRLLLTVPCFASSSAAAASQPPYLANMRVCGSSPPTHAQVLDESSAAGTNHDAITFRGVRMATKPQSETKLGSAVAAIGRAATYGGLRRDESSYRDREVRSQKEIPWVFLTLLLSAHGALEESYRCKKAHRRGSTSFN